MSCALVHVWAKKMVSEVTSLAECASWPSGVWTARTANRTIDLLQLLVLFARESVTFLPRSATAFKLCCIQHKKWRPRQFAPAENIVLRATQPECSQEMNTTQTLDCLLVCTMCTSLKHQMTPFRACNISFTICFTICLCISPDLDGYQGTKNETMCPERPTKGPETQIRSHRTANVPRHFRHLSPLDTLAFIESQH
jgi:hypothetical protein